MKEKSRQKAKTVHTKDSKRGTGSVSIFFLARRGTASRIHHHPSPQTVLLFRQWIHHRSLLATRLIPVGGLELFNGVDRGSDLRHGWIDFGAEVR